MLEGPDGNVALPHALRDPELRHEITTEIRRRVWLEFTEHVKRRVAYDKEQVLQLKERRSQTAKARS
jgi:hypothetical protein